MQGCKMIQEPQELTVRDLLFFIIQDNRGFQNELVTMRRELGKRFDRMEARFDSLQETVATNKEYVQINLNLKNQLGFL